MSDNKKDIKEWAKELKHNEKFAKKYEGLKTVEGILATARKDGYDIKKEELMEFDLDSVAGGANLGLFNAEAKADTEVKGVEVHTKQITMKNQKASNVVGAGASSTAEFNFQ